MTIGANDRHVSFTAAAGQTVFDADFPIAAAADIEVWRNRTGVVSRLVLATDYTVTNVGLTLNARITLVAGATLNDVIVLQGQRSEARATDFIVDGDFRSDDIDGELDRLYIHAQEAQRDIDRSLRKRPTDPAGPYEAEGADVRNVGLLRLADKSAAIPASPPAGFADLWMRLVAGQAKLVWKLSNGTEIDLTAQVDAAASAAAAAASAGTAVTARDAALAAAAGLTLPALVLGTELKILRVKADRSGYEHATAGAGNVVGVANWSADNRLIRASGTVQDVDAAAPVTLSNDGDIEGLRFLELNAAAAPATPAADRLRVYFKSGSAALFMKDAGGLETQLGGGSSGHGQCLLEKTGANLVLRPMDGNQIVIDGKAEAIPSAGVTLATAGLAASTTYWIYAFMSAGTMTLEASTTARATSTAAGNQGVEIKSGAGTRTLVGLARTDGSTAWVDTDAQRFVLSWFNRRRKVAKNKLAASFTTTSLTNVEAMPTRRAEFLVWAGVAAHAIVDAYNWNSGAANSNVTQAAFDGTDIGERQGTYGNNGFPATANHTATLSEGYHYATCMVSVTAGTGTWQVSSYSDVSVRAIIEG